MQSGSASRVRHEVIRFAAALALVMPGPVAAHAQSSPPLEHLTVTVDGHPLALWARRPPNAKRAVLLIHGRTWSSLPDFDLQVPGESRSIMAALAARGYAAFALDLRGYGKTPRDGTGWNTPRRSADDVSAVLTWIATREPHITPPALVGWSNGALISQLVAQAHADRISALVLYGYPMEPDTRFTDLGAPRTPQRQRTTRDDAASDFMSPDVTSTKMLEAYVTAAVAADPIRSDWRLVAQFNALNPSRVKVPTLLLQGENDPSVTQEGLDTLFKKLGTKDKQFVILKGGDHAALLEDTKPGFVEAVVGFLERKRP